MWPFLLASSERVSSRRPERDGRWRENRRFGRSFIMPISVANFDVAGAADRIVTFARELIASQSARQVEFNAHDRDRATSYLERLESYVAVISSPARAMRSAPRSASRAPLSATASRPRGREPPGASSPRSRPESFQALVM